MVKGRARSWSRSEPPAGTGTVSAAPTSRLVGEPCSRLGMLQENSFRQEDPDSPGFLRCRSPAGMNCDGKRNLCGQGSDAVNQQQKSCLGVGKGVDLE